MMMIDQYILGSFVASLFGFVLLYKLRRKIKKPKSNSKIGNKNECINGSAADGGSQADSAGEVDVIIVGAGVAGAALAYTLGKITLIYLIGSRSRISERFDLFDDNKLGRVLMASPISIEFLLYLFSTSVMLQVSTLMTKTLNRQVINNVCVIHGIEGRRVRVIERDLTEPDRIVGELLQPGGYLKLIELGLEDCLRDIDAQRVFGYALYMDGNNTKLSYPLEKFDSDVSGRSFHNGRFIQRMREKASTLSNVRLEQGTVTSLLEENGTVKGVQYKTRNGEEITTYAPLTVVCDGCFSNLRRSLCTPKVENPSCFVGLILENCELPYANHGHVVLGDPSPILFYPISTTEIRCLVDVPGQKVPSVANGEMAHYLKTTVAPQIPPQLYHSFIDAIEKGNIRTMPNRSMPAIPLPTPGALLMGDAFNMRHPLTGGGMTVALSDIVLLRDLLRPIHDLSDASTLCKYLESFYTLRKPVASTINTLAGALYKVFCASPDLARKEMRQACFDYLSLGGIFSNGPISLLSGLNPRPLHLFCHFFAVAVYGVGRLLLPFPSPKRFWLGARLLSAASGIIFPIINAEGIRQMFFPATVPAYYRASPSSIVLLTMTKETSLYKDSSGESHLDITKCNDVIIVGAGVAGSVLAHTLGKDGRKVHVIERNLNEPNRIVGELLQPAGYLKLLELGLEDCVKNIDAQMVYGYTVYKDGKSIKLPYPLQNYDIYAKRQHLFPSTLTFHFTLVSKINVADQIVERTYVKLVQGTAVSLIEERGTIKGIRYNTMAGQELTVFAPLTVICDGCFSSFRKFLSTPKIDTPSHFAGFIIENCELPYPNYVHLILGNRTSFVLYPISSTEVRFLIDFPGPKPPSISNGEMSHILKTTVAPQVPIELYGAFLSSVDKAKIRVMPISCMPAKPRLTPGAILLGDALNMRHAITGGGMTVALHDITVLKNIFKNINLNDTEKVTKYTQDLYNIRKPMAFTMNVVADSLYNVMTISNEESRKEIQQACFDYISRFSKISEGVVGLVSGINPHRYRLLLHLFAIAIYIAGSMILVPVPSPKRVYAAARLALGVAAIVIPIIWNEV
ncbi:hypothetical protein ACJIZ3_001224 [Penstemon smallii]|uniref:squalene monooxygenase n=1 Tax=Penstemon smallii TaxID=265156 RepID=A0ABD3U4H7_9LAMI